MRFERGLYSVFFWLGAAIVFAWMTVALPLQIFPKLLLFLEPGLEGLVHYFMAVEMTFRFGVSFVWVGLFVTIAGILEIPMGRPAAFSTSIMGKLAPSLLCIVIMGIAGTVVDHDNNQPLRSAVMALDQTLQFAVERQGQEIDKKVSRDMHLAALRKVTDLIEKPRQLTIGSFDQYLEQVHIIVRFDDALADCLSVYNQPITCEVISP